MDYQALFRISYGIYVIAANDGEYLNGCIINTVMQVTNEPVQCAVSVAKSNLTHDNMIKKGSFSISVLAQDCPMDTIALFGFNSGRDKKKYEQVQYINDENNNPVLKNNTLAYYSCKINKIIDIGTHSIFVSEITAAEELAAGTPMTYSYYREIKKGTAPAAAPTYNKAAYSVNPVQTDDKYICTVCKYVYDPQTGDIEHGISPDTNFEDLPDDWVCPVCKKPKDKFVKL